MATSWLAVRIARRFIVKLLGIAGFLLALVGGVLILVSAISGGGLSATSLILRGFEAILGLGAILGGFMIFTGPMRFGGLIAVFAGVLLLVITSVATAAVMVFAAGIIGIVGAAMKPAWWKFWKR